MKVKPGEKLKARKTKKHLKAKRSKPAENNLSVNLVVKKSNGASNWDQLAKVLGYEMKKPKTPTMQTKQNGHDSRKPVAENDTQPVSNGASRNVWSQSGSTLAQKLRKSFSESTDTAADSETNSVGRDAASKFKQSASKESSRFSRNSSKTNGVLNVNHTPGTTHPVDLSRGYTNCVAMDCEMVGTGKDGKDSMIARVSIVNKFGDCIYDTYVKPMEEITDFRTHVSGIRPSDLVNGKDLYTVQVEVMAILQDRILIGHALKNDMDVLFMSHPKSKTRDTARYRPFRELFDGRTPSLKKLAQKLLGVDIQSGEHSSVEDAQAAMQIYLMHRNEWEKSLKKKKKRRNASNDTTFTATSITSNNTMDDT